MSNLSDATVLQNELQVLDKLLTAELQADSVAVSVDAVILSSPVSKTCLSFALYQ